MEWFSWTNLFYLLGLILAGVFTLVASKYKRLVYEMKDVMKALEDGYEDGSLSKKEKDKIMKECLDVLKSLINLKWKIF
jgi:hypothetical protein